MKWSLTQTFLFAASVMSVEQHVFWPLKILAQVGTLWKEGFIMLFFQKCYFEALDCCFLLSIVCGVGQSFPNVSNSWVHLCVILH